MPFELPPLPYDYAALEPHIDEATLHVHHDKHHQTYVDKANAALAGTKWADATPDEILRNFGTGWGWLVQDGPTLKVISTHDQDSPLSSGLTPLLTCDVWEHAYYLKYQNRRPDYVSAWWNVVDWDKVAGRLAG